MNRLGKEFVSASYIFRPMRRHDVSHEDYKRMSLLITDDIAEDTVFSFIKKNDRVHASYWALGMAVVWHKVSRQRR